MKIILLRYISWPCSTLQLACRLAGVPLVPPLRGSAHRLFSCYQPRQCPEPFLGYSSLGLYNAPGRALWTTPWRGFTFAPPSALRAIVCDATMTTPGGRTHPMSRSAKRPRARRTCFYHVSEFPSTGLRPFALPIVHGVVYGETLCPVSIP
jgi:hypothetical protein